MFGKKEVWMDRFDTDGILQHVLLRESEPLVSSDDKHGGAGAAGTAVGR